MTPEGWAYLAVTWNTSGASSSLRSKDAMDCGGGVLHSIATMIDMASRRVVGLVLADRMRTKLVEDALKMAFVTFHADQQAP